MQSSIRSSDRVLLKDAHQSSHNLLDRNPKLTAGHKTMNTLNNKSSESKLSICFAAISSNREYDLSESM